MNVGDTIRLPVRNHFWPKLYKYATVHAVADPWVVTTDGQLYSISEVVVRTPEQAQRDQAVTVLAGLPHDQLLQILEAGLSDAELQRLMSSVPSERIRDVEVATMRAQA